MAFNSPLGSGATLPTAGDRLTALSPFPERTRTAGIDLAALDASKISQAVSGKAVGGISDPFFTWFANDGSDFRSMLGYQFVITDQGRYLNHIFLPLNPQSVSVNVPVASALAVTMKGITEDNNAAPLRQISITGTSGMWHTAQPKDSSNATSSNLLNYLFKNTIQAAGRIAQQAGRVAAAFGGNQQQNQGPLNYVNPEASLELAKNSGYFFFHNLVNFLDFYISGKKDRRGKGLRLTFQMHRDRMYYDVVLNSYSWRKMPGTLEYEYTITMTAYRRRPEPAAKINDLSSRANQPVTAGALNGLARIINTLRETRKLLATASGVLKGIRADAEDSLFTPIREVILLGSDLLGIAVSIAEFPKALKNSAKASIDSALKDVNGSSADERQAVDTTLKEFGLRDGEDASATPWKNRLQVQVQDGLANQAVRPETASPIEKIFQDDTKYTAVFEQFDPDQLNLPSAVRDQFAAETDRVRNLTESDLDYRRGRIRDFSVSVADAFGGGSAAYNNLVNLPAPAKTFRKMTVDDMFLLSQINDAAMAMDQAILAIREVSANSDNDYSKFYEQFAVANGIPFQESASRFFVPFPGDGTLEQLAVQYLGDESRWIEIAAVNGLKEPYVDEDGFERSLLSNAAQSSVQISDISNLFVGQIVQVVSDAKVALPKKIRSIDKVSAVEFIVAFDEGTSLVGYKVSDNARIKAYLPDTVNSSKLIAIPSSSPVNVPGKVKLTPGREDLNGLGLIAKVDILLQSDGQISMDGSGDVRLATGMTNLVQAARMLLSTKQGSLLQAPGYGNPLQAGISTAEINVQELLKSLNKQFQQDDRFLGVLAGQVSINGPAGIVDILLGVSGTTLHLPISTQLPL